MDRAGRSHSTRKVVQFYIRSWRGASIATPSARIGPAHFARTIESERKSREARQRARSASNQLNWHGRGQISKDRKLKHEDKRVGLWRLASVALWVGVVLVAG